MADSTFSSHGRLFTILPVKSGADRAEVFAFMQTHFRVQEPITNALNCTASDTLAFYTDICRQCFQHESTCLLARDGQGQLAGIVLSSLWLAEQPETTTATDVVVKPVDHTNGGGAAEEFGPEIRSGPYQSLNANRLFIYLDHVERDIGSLFPGVQRILKLDILAVHPMFLRLGLGSHLLERTVHLARRLLCSLVLTSATAVASQRLFTNFGFQTVRKIRFDQFLEDGKPVYRNLHDNGTGAELLAFQL